MIVFAHTKFGLVRIQGTGVKGGGCGIRPRSERVFQIPVQIGLRDFRNFWLTAKVSLARRHYFTFLE